MEDAAHLIARQYEAWAYPPPFADIAAKLETGYVQMGDPALYSPALWPEGRPRDALRILVAGCGTVQAAVLAYTNPGCKVFGVDVSEASLAHERFLQDRHGLSNLALYKGDLRDAHQIGRDFDVVFATGVLHHLADPDRGLRALSAVLAPEGVLIGMVYASGRRTGVYMVQDMLRRLGVTPDAEGVALTRRLLADLPPGHFVHRYIEAAGELTHDAALVDTFLNPQDRAYTVPQTLDLLERNSLAFQGWAEPAWYWPEAAIAPGTAIAEGLAALPDRQQWAVVEMATLAVATHVFIARPAGLHSGAYKLDFADSEALRFVPHRAPGIVRKGPFHYTRGVLEFQLGPAEQALFESADGRRSLVELLTHPALAKMTDRNAFGRAAMAHLWKMGHLMISRQPRR
jgi:SAM-dependent methyltransferase